MAIVFSNNARTTLASNISNSATTITVADGSVFPSLTGSDIFYCTIDDGTNNEIVKVTAISSNTLTVVRGQDNTSANAFVSGDLVELRLVAAVLDTFSQVDAGEVTADEFIGDLRGAVIFKAEAGEAVSKGDVVYVSGISGNTPVVALADADFTSKMPAFGLVLTAASANGSTEVVTFGTISGLDTSSFSVGDTLYVSTTAGALTNSKPTGEASLIQNIGMVQRSHASAGSVKVGGAGRTATTPNLNDGNIFIGNASNQATTASLNTKIEDYLDANGLTLPDDVKAQFGDDNDLQIYHNGTHSYIDDAGTGNLYIRASQSIALQKADGTEDYLTANNNGAVTLYHNNSPKIATTSGGVSVSGDITVGDSHYIGNQDPYDNLLLLSSSGENVVMAAAGDIYLNTNATSTSSVGNTRVQLTSTGTLLYNGTQIIDGSRNFTNIGTISSGAITSSGDIKTTNDIWVNYNSSGNEYLHLNYASGGDGGILFRHANTLKWQQTAVTGSGQPMNWYSYDASDTVMSLSSAGLLTTDSGYQVNGTTVISSARNLENIGTISSGTITTSNAMASSPYLHHFDVSGTNQTGGGAGVVFQTSVTSGTTSIYGAKIQAVRTASDNGSADLEFYTSNANTSSGAHQLALTLDENQNAIFEGTATFNYNGDAIAIKSLTDQTNPVGITFTSQGATGTQIGHVRYTHRNTDSYDSLESFTIGGTETTTTILADGKLMFKEGLYIKPSSGTGAGTQIITSAGNLTNIGNITSTGVLDISAGTTAIPVSISGSNSSYTSVAIKNTGSGSATLWMDASNGDLAGSDYASIKQDNSLQLVLRTEASAGSIVLEPAGTAALTLDTSQNATFAGTISSGAIDSEVSGADLPSETTANLYLVDTRSLAANTGGSIVFSSYYQGTTAVSGGSYIKGYKENATSGDYGYGLKFGVRENGQGTTGPVFTLNSSGNAIFTGTISSGAVVNIYTSTDRGYFVAGTNDASNQHLYLGSYHGTTLKELTFSGSNNGFYPQTSASIDLGLSSKKFKNLYLSGYVSSTALASPDGTQIVFPNNNGNVMIGSTGTPSAKLHVSGTIESTGTINIDPADTTLPNTYFSAERYNDSNGKLIFGVAELSPSGNTTGETYIGNHNRRVHIGAVFDGTQTATASIMHMMIDTDGDLFVSQNNTHTRWFEANTRNLSNIGTISSGNITTTGYLRGPATFTIDPATHGDDTGTVVIAGNLQVDGTTTTINSTTLTVDDKNITLASGSTNAAAANGAGLTVDCGSDTDATFTYDGTNDEWDFNKNVTITSTGTIGTNTPGNGYLQVTDGTNTLALDPNEIYSNDDLVITTGGDFDIRNGSFSMGNQIVITSSKNIINVGTITASGLITGDRFLSGLGTAASPAFQVGDTDSGFYDSGANVIGVTLGGNLEYEFTPTQLDLKTNTLKTGAITVEESLADDQTMINIIQTNTGSDIGTQESFIDFTFIDANANNYPQVKIGAQVGQNADADSTIKEGSGAFVVHTSNAVDSTAGGQGGMAERLRVDYQGHLGLGIANPAIRLHTYHPTSNVVARFESGDGQVYIDLHDSNSGTYGALLGHSSTKLFHVADASVSDKLVLDNSGSLTLSGDYVRVNDSGTQAFGVFKEKTITGSGTSNDLCLFAENITGGGEIHFMTAGSTAKRLTINSTGNIGINNTNPQTKLHIEGNNVGIPTNYGGVVYEAVDAQIDVVSDSSGTWGSAINFVEGTSSTANTDVWSIARKTTGGAGDSSLNFNFGTGNQHDNTARVIFSSAGNVGMASGHSSGKFAVMSSSVHGSYDLYNNGTTYLNGATIVDADLTITSGDINLRSTTGTSPAIAFNTNSGTDSGADMAIRAVGEGLDFYEPEDADKLHMRIIDDGGVNAVFGLHTGAGDGTERIDPSGNLVNIGTITASGYLRTSSNGIYGKMSDEWHTANALRGGNFSADIGNDTTVLKLFPASPHDESGNTRAANDYNTGIAFMHLDPDNSSWGSGYTGAQAWIGLKVESLPGQELDSFVIATNGSSTAGTMPTERFKISSTGAATFTGSVDVGGNITASGGTVDVEVLKADDTGTTPGSCKLHVGTLNSAGSSAVAQFGGFIRAADHLIVHGGAGSSNSVFMSYTDGDADFRTGEGTATSPSVRVNALKINTATVITSAAAVQNITSVSMSGNLYMSKSQPWVIIENTTEDGGGIVFNDNQAGASSTAGPGSSSQQFRITYNCGSETLVMGHDDDSYAGFDFGKGGALTCSGNVTAFSDERLKDNIETLDGKKVLEMRGVSFTKDGKEGSGVIAQELEKVAPELVTTDKVNGIKSVAYGNLVGYLIEAIKDQQKEIEYMKSEIKTLKENNNGN